MTGLIKGSEIIRATVKGYSGTAEVVLVENDGYNSPHYRAFISVPFQDSKWVYVGSKNAGKDKALNTAKEQLEYRLASCMMI